MAEEPGSNLPAPYVNPWSLLRRDLKAVLASLGLTLQEVLRRNREGSLPRPPFWPEALGSVFWPLLLVLVIALPAAGRLVVLGNHGPRSRSGSSDSAPALSPAPPAILAPVPEPSAVDEADAVPFSGPSAGPFPAPAAAPPELLDAPPATPSRAELLLARLMQPEADGVLLAVEEEAARLCLVLRLDPTFVSLPRVRQERLAGFWQEQGRSLGFEQLELRDPSGHQLGRSASVGSGMILFTTAAGG